MLARVRWLLTHARLLRDGPQVAKVIKSLELNKATEPPPYYASRFAANFKAKFVATDEAVEVGDKI